MQSLSEILKSVFNDPRPCPLCQKPGPTFTDREKGTRYCFSCLETAVVEAEAELMAEWLALPLEDGPEDAETIALGRAVIAELMPA